jgi:hypothetical protein
MVGFRDKQLDLSDIPDFEKLVEGLGDEQLASFCRLLTLTVSGPEVWLLISSPHSSLSDLCIIE